MKTKNFDELEVKFWVNMLRPRTKKYLRELKKRNRTIRNDTFNTAEKIAAQNEAIRRILE